jgi:hypothetical protein
MCIEGVLHLIWSLGATGPLALMGWGGPLLGTTRDDGAVRGSVGGRDPHPFPGPLTKY